MPPILRQPEQLQEAGALHLKPMPRQRFDRIDALRGGSRWSGWRSYHFCFDLNHFKLIAPAGLLQRSALDLAAHLHPLAVPVLRGSFTGRRLGAKRQAWPRFWKRWVQIAGRRSCS